MAWDGSLTNEYCENDHYILLCPVLNEQVHEVTFSDVYGSIDEQYKVVQIFKKVLRSNSIFSCLHSVLLKWHAVRCLGEFAMKLSAPYITLYDFLHSQVNIESWKYIIIFNTDNVDLFMQDYYIQDWVFSVKL